MKVKVQYFSASPSTYEGDIDIQLTETYVVIKYFAVDLEKNVEVIIPLSAIWKVVIIE